MIAITLTFILALLLIGWLFEAVGAPTESLAVLRQTMRYSFQEPARPARARTVVRS